VGKRRESSRGGVGGLLVPALAAGLLAFFGGVRETVGSGARSPCDHPPTSALSYHYPVKPFDRQHPIRGYFGDPRTLTSKEFGADSPGSPGSYSFHNGVDISAPAGAPVYPVVSGIAHIGYADEVIVVTGDGRVFQYFHIQPAVRSGQQVRAYRTLLGRVLPRWLHVHLTEIDGFRVHNPLDPGHLEPYHDQTVPTVTELLFKDADGETIDPHLLRGLVWIAADASDLPARRVPGEWLGFRVTPALVAWRMSSETGAPVIRETIRADFRRTEPANRDFWRVYAAGTYQNFPVFAHHLFFRREGRYLFNLTPAPLDTSRLPDGKYTIIVEVADTCGNRSSLSQPIEIRND
jgi:hypothetical protein